MNRSRVTGDLVSQNNIFVDIANDRVGIGSTIPTQKLDVTGTVKATAFSGDGSGLTGVTGAGQLSNVADDTTPQLGGNLDVNGKDIVSASNGDIEFAPNGTGAVVFKGVSSNGGNGAGRFKLNCEVNSHGITIQGPPHSAGADYTLTLPNDDGNSGQFLQTNGSGVLSFATVTTDLVGDTSPQLGGNLDVQSSEITTSTSNGNIKLTPNGSGFIEIKGASGNDGTLQLNCSANSHGVKIKSPPHSAGATYTLTLPNNDGDSGQFLQTNGSGVLSFASAITDLVGDSSPQLGGNLDVQAREINTSTTNGNITLNPNGTGVIEIKGSGTGGTLQLNCEANSHGIKLKSPPHSAAASYTLTFPNSIVNNGALKTDSSGNLSFGLLAASNIADDAITSAKILNGTIVNADINASAAIAGTKIDPDFGSQNITTTGNITGSDITANGGDLTISGSTAVLHLTDTNNDDDFSVINQNGTFIIRDATNSLNRISVDSNGVVNIPGNTDFGAGIDVTGSTTTGSLVSSGAISGTTGTFSGDITANGNIVGDNSTNISGINQVIATALYTSDSIIHRGETGDNTQIRFPADDTVIIQTDGSERVRIDSSGNFGVGTDSPDRKLDVSGTGNVYGKFQSTNATGAGIEVKDTAERWLIQADGGVGPGLAFYDLGRTAYRMIIDSSGNVLVGTTDSTVYNNGDGQSEGIVLRGGDVIDIARAGDLQLTLNRQTNDGPHVAFYRSGVQKSLISTRNNSFCIDVNGSERLRIQSDGVMVPKEKVLGTHPFLFGGFGSIGSSQGCRITGGTGSHPACLSLDGGSSPTLEFGSKSGETIIGTNSYGSSPMNFKTSMGIANLSGGTIRMQITSDGEVRKPSQPFFWAYNSSTYSWTNNAVISYETEANDQGGNYNNSTYTFTAPVDGVYLFSVYFRAGGGFSEFSYHLQKNGGNFIRIIAQGSWGGNDMQFGQTIQACSQGDTWRVIGSGSHGGATGGYQYNGFQGYLLG